MKEEEQMFWPMAFSQRQYMQHFKEWDFLEAERDL